MTTRWAAAIGCVLALSGIPLFTVTVSVAAPGRAAVCDDAQTDCEDTSCTSDDCDQPPATVVVPGRGPRANVNACVDLGGRRRVSVNGCI